jgi:hypothetical protein
MKEKFPGICCFCVMLSALNYSHHLCFPTVHSDLYFTAYALYLLTYISLYLVVFMSYLHIKTVSHHNCWKPYAVQQYFSVMYSNRQEEAICFTHEWLFTNTWIHIWGIFKNFKILNKILCLNTVYQCCSAIL